jgi:O-antigen ligase
MAQGALYMGTHYPLFGVGTGDYANEMTQLQNNHSLPDLSHQLIMSQPQNSYLLGLAMLGDLGLLFFWYLWTVSARALRSRDTPEGWFILMYMAIFVTGSFSDTLIWAYANVFTLAIITALPSTLVEDTSNDDSA